MHLFPSADFFSKLTFSIFFMNTIRAEVLNTLDPDQDQHSVGADLGPNCLQRLSAEDKKIKKTCSARSGRYPDLVKSCMFYMKYYNTFQGVSLYDKGWFGSGRHYNINISANEFLKLHETFSHVWKRGMTYLCILKHI